jgi:hypothetical protein
VDGQPLEEKNPKWLQDDYVKFIRFAEWRIEQTGQGVVAFITNHAYLDNPTFRGMRARLLRTFQRLYVVNLHGNARRKERAPDGSPDENLFDIQQGVALLIAIRKPDKFPSAQTLSMNRQTSAMNRKTLSMNRQTSAMNRKTLSMNRQTSAMNRKTLSMNRQTSTMGTTTRPSGTAMCGASRDAKYDFLRTATLESIRWTPLTPRAPMYLFVPQDTALEAEYQGGWRIPDIFPVHSVGIVTARGRADHPPHARRRVADGVRTGRAGA